MKRILLAIFVLFILISLPSEVFAAPSVTIYPEDVISKDSSFLIKVDPKTTERPIRITWAVYNMGEIGIGSFPIVNGKGICYFSNTDKNATCGPSPFTQAGETEIYIYVVTPTEVKNVTVPLNISDISIPTDEIYREDNTVYMWIDSPERDEFRFGVYNEDLSVYLPFGTRQLTYNPTKHRYEGNYTPSPGVYYFGFIAKEGNNYGSGLLRIEIPSAEFLNVETDKESYWLGEKIEIKGTTSGTSVKGEIKFPNHTKAMDFDTNVNADGTFSYDFFSKLGWPDGLYEIKTSYPLEKTASFSIAYLLDIKPSYVSAKINKSEDFEGLIKIKNLGNEALNISATASGELKQSEISLSKNVLEPNEESELRINISNIQNNVIGKIKLMTNSNVELEIPVSIGVETPSECPECPECPPCKAKAFSITPKIWSQECIVDEEISRTFDIKNLGETTLDSFEYEIEDEYSDNYLSSLDSEGNINIPLSDLVIQSGGSESIDIAITPSYTGTYKGSIILKSNGNSDFILVDLNCFEDLSYDIESSRGSLEEIGNLISSELYFTISDYLDQAESAYSVGNYKQAKGNLDQANALIEASGSVSPPQGFDFITIIIIVIIVVVAAVAVYFLKFRKRAPPEEYEEGFKEEF
jgi:hypothetical protein